MKFAHLADCHLGSWSRKPELQELNIKAFEYAINFCIDEKVAFVIIAGDFFDISFPTNTEVLSRAFKKLRELKEKGIPLYLIPGSHDFSASGDSMLKVCEAAGLCKNLMDLLEYDKEGNVTIKFFKDKERNVLITGILGKRIGLEVEILKNLNKEKIEQQIENENCLKIFILHTAISELLPEGLPEEHIESISYKELPKGFHYYAAGHIHDLKTIKEEQNNSIIAQSGCIFPNNFTELTSVREGSFIIADFNEQTKELSLKEEKIKLKDIETIEINAENKEAKDVEDEIRKRLEKADIKGKILTLKVSGTLKKGKTSDINFESIYKLVNEGECFSFLRNTHGLKTKEFEIEASKAESVEEIEKEIIQSALKDLSEEEKAEKEKTIKTLIKTLDKERAEDEIKDAFSSRLIEELIKSLNLEEKFLT